MSNLCTDITIEIPVAQLKEKFKIQFQEKTLVVSGETTLRKALIDAEMSPHNGNAKWLNCKGMGTCGTCAVEIVGEVTPPTAMERWRLNFPPHQSGTPLRLACQIKPKSDCIITKHKGFWGELIE